MLDVDGSGDGGGEEVVALLSGDLFAMLVGLDGECFVLRNGFFRVSFMPFQMAPTTAPTTAPATAPETNEHTYADRYRHTDT